MPTPKKLLKLFMWIWPPPYLSDNPTDVCAFSVESNAAAPGATVIGPVGIGLIDLSALQGVKPDRTLQIKITLARPPQVPSTFSFRFDTYPLIYDSTGPYGKQFVPGRFTQKWFDFGYNNVPDLPNGLPKFSIKYTVVRSGVALPPACWDPNIINTPVHSFPPPPRPPKKRKPKIVVKLVRARGKKKK